MDKKINKKSPVKKDDAETKGVKKAPVKKSIGAKAKGGQKSDKIDVEGVAKTAAEVRSKQEENSIAPPSSNLVSAFDMFKKRKVSTSSPSVTRLAAGASLPKPPTPKPAVVTPPTPVANIPEAPVAPAPTPISSAPVVPPPPAPPVTPAPKPQVMPPGMPAVKPQVPGTTQKAPTPPPAAPSKPVVLRPGAITTKPASQTPPPPARPNMWIV
jgi:hypothetical protein